MQLYTLHNAGQVIRQVKSLLCIVCTPTNNFMQDYCFVSSRTIDEGRGQYAKLVVSESYRNKKNGALSILSDDGFGGGGGLCWGQRLMNDS